MKIFICPFLASIVTCSAYADTNTLNETQIDAKNGITHTIGGKVKRLQTNLQLVLNNTSTIELAPGAKTFTFPDKLTSGQTFVITYTSPADQNCSVQPTKGKVHNKNIKNIQVICSNNFTLGGTVTGLNGTIKLKNANGANLSIQSNGVFKFPGHSQLGKPYSVSVKRAPRGQICSIENGRGNITKNVNNIHVVCSSDTQNYNISGTVTGLNMDGLSIRNGDEILSINSGASAFQLTKPVAAGGSYDVTIHHNPQDLACSVSNGQGQNVQANVSNVDILCNSTPLSIGATVTGLNSDGKLVLQNNGGDNLVIEDNNEFTPFDLSIPLNSTYNVTVFAQPLGQTCIPSNNTGIALEDVNVTVTCSTNLFSVGGQVTGLQDGDTLILSNNNDNGGDGNEDQAIKNDGHAISHREDDGTLLNITTNGSYFFGASSNSDYNITVWQNPIGKICTVINGVGTVLNDNVTNVDVSCVPSQ